ncbi:MAG: hypothetical protein A2622_07655 [Bdellovibrionales bacterium RIFCSPHIGHO2_01_FULL_40_29]|nr:MAG: hypothetical protein A2622_07655 [Bdellovibrionales bacterium RIFCSPHIGHO2_01_FULL_40_29]OFZ34204.1 MAG: hypothetical protein A3D17_03995 [Bdellovibrionales bacterium RIFCSPHIGHO2_02_FULL_40_15]
MTKFYLIFLIAVTISPNIQAQNKCISGKESSSHLLDQMKTASQNPQSPTYSIFKAYNLGQSTEGNAIASEFCTDDKCRFRQSEMADFKRISEATTKVLKAPQMAFKMECVIAGAQFKAETSEIHCPSGKRTKGSFDFCVNQDLLAYQNAVVSNFQDCLQASGIRTLDAAHLFKMFTLESAFKPYYAYPGGVGFGQLTSIFVNDLHEAHRGRKFIQAMANSNNSQCQAAKIIAEKDLQNKPRHSDNCSFVTIGEGLERNILYSMLGLASSWKNDIEPKLRKYIAKHAGHPRIEEVKNMALLNSYGPGRAKARATIDRLSGLPPDKFLAAIKKPLRTKRGNLTYYTDRIERRQKNLLTTKLIDPVKSEYAKTGANACVNTN